MLAAKDFAITSVVGFECELETTDLAVLLSLALEAKLVPRASLVRDGFQGVDGLAAGSALWVRHDDGLSVDQINREENDVHR